MIAFLHFFRGFAPIFHFKLSNFRWWWRRNSFAPEYKVPYSYATVSFCWLFFA